MKKYIWLVLVCLMSFGIGHAKFAEEPDNTIHDFKKQKTPVGESFFLRPLLLGKTLPISLWIEDEQPGQFEQYSQLVKQAYQDWFDNAVKHIVASGREKEMQDILPYLKRPVSIKIVRYPKAELEERDFYIDNQGLFVLIFKTLDHLYSFPPFEMNTDYAVGVYNKDIAAIAISQEELPVSQRYILTHEVGHTLGFADQYYPDNAMGDSVFASHSTKNIMSGEYELSCDDADGLINIADRILGLSKRGGKQGWKSLCSNSDEYYKAGMSTKTDRYRFQSRSLPWNEIISIEEYEKSRKIATQEFEMIDLPGSPFHFVKEVAVLKRDSQGFPSLMRGQNGETVYLTGAYYKLERVIVKNKKLLSYLILYPTIEEDRDIRKMMQYFQINGNSGRLEGVLDINGYYSAKYVQQTPSYEEAVLEMYFKQQDGQADSVSYTTQWSGPWNEVLNGRINKNSSKKEQELERAIQRKQMEQLLYQWGTHWYEYMQSTPQ